MSKITETKTMYVCDRCAKSTELVVNDQGFSSVGSWIEIEKNGIVYDMCDECAEGYKDFLADRPSLVLQIMIIDSIKETLGNPLAGQEAGWVAGEYVEAGFIRTYMGQAYECIQGHVTQAGWVPPDTPALWKTYTPAGVIAAWKQPLGAHDAYANGAKVTHKGSIWVSTTNANVWEPGVYGWVKES